MTRAEIITFARLVEKNLLFQGATITDCFSTTVYPKRGKPWQLLTNKFSIQTTCGELHITVYDSWIACRFQDVDRAKRNLPVSLQAFWNPFSGKWNYHYSNWTPHDASRDFQEALSQILPQSANIEGVPA